MFKNVRIFFEHNKSERNGSIAIIVFCLLVILGFWLWGEIFEPTSKDLSSVSLSFNKDEHISQDTALNRLQIFNPNTASDSLLIELGFEEREIKMIRNYQKAGGSFKVKSDFSKLYFMDEVRYDKYEAYLDLPDSVSFDQKEKHNEQKGLSWSDTSSYIPYSRTSKIVELNSADTLSLKSLPGIGSFYANSIVEYRSSLGGYYNLGQLLELWKMTPDKIDHFADRITIDSDLIKKMDINIATSQELAAHPYIDFELANRIVISRESEGLFNKMEDLKARKLVGEDLSSKLAAYLQFE